MRPPSLRVSSRDLVAGLSVAIVLVPQSLAYAQLAGVPPSRGLFAAAVPPLVAAPFSSSPYLQPGPTAVTALMTYGALSPLAPLGSARYVELGLLLAVMVGIIRVGVGAARAGVLAFFLSEPLLNGFVPASALLIVASQIPVVLGTSPHGKHEFYRAAWVLGNPSKWNLETVAFGAAATCVIVAARRLHHLVPSVLIAVAGAIITGNALGYDGAVLHHLHAQFPPLSTHLPLRSTPRLIIPAAAIALVGFAEASSIARTYATADRRHWDANREFVSQGLANVAAGFFGGFPVGASFSRSALNRLAGAETSASGFITGLAVLGFLPLGFVLDGMPLCVLGATVILAVIPLIRIDRIVNLLRMSRPQGMVTVTAFVLTLLLSPHIERAIVIAVLIAVGVHLWWELRLEIDVRVDGDRLRLTPQGVLWFGTAPRLEERLTKILSSHPTTSHVELRLDALGRIDLTGALALRALLEDARAAGLTVTVQGFPQHSRRILERVLVARAETATTP